jgi:pilus assembly protein FimV
VQKSLLKQLAIRLGHQTTTAKSLVILKLLGAVAALMLSTHVSAIGLGGINVLSALGQPLEAEVELVSVGKTEKASLVARLASPDTYKGAGLEYPYGNKFKLQIESRANGEPYVRISSAQPVNDPFVSMLVELNWASGKLLREYTFLLDPPDYVAERPEPMQVQAVAPTVQIAAPEIAASPAAPVAVSPVESQPVEQQAEKPVSKPTPTKSTKPTTAEASVASGDINVVRGDTLSRIARQYKPADVSLERMLVALYRANAEQFDSKNMNRIRAGKILRLPDQSELMDVSQSDAVKEIRAQTADWNAYRQKLAAAAPAASQPQEAQQAASGKIASSVADKAPVAKESAKEVLKLSRGEAPGDQATGGAATGKPMTAEDRKNAEQEDAIAREKNLKEEQARAALLEQNLKDMERLAQLKSEAAALAAQPPASAASEVKPAPVAKPKPKPKSKPQPVVVPQPSLTDQILEEPLYLAGGAAILLGLGGLGFMMKRRKQAVATVENSEETGETTGSHLTVPPEPSPDTGDFTATTGEHPEAAPQQDEVDPISEADLFLNFGRDAQAEEILKEALLNTPNNHQIHLKLLGIYANRKDANSFSSIARQLKDSGDEEAWQQAAAMGRKLEPGNPMYGGAVSVEDTGSATMQTTVMNAMPDSGPGEAPTQQAQAPDVDFDLGEPETTSVLTGDDTAAAGAEAMDFDVTSTNPSLEAPSEMDFDVTSTHPSIPAVGEEKEAGLPNLDDLVFDVTSSSQPSMQEAEQEEPTKAAPDEDAGMEFTLDFPVGDAAEKPAPAAQDVGADFADISLNLDDIETPGAAAPESAKDEHWHEVATKLDLAKAYQEMGDATGAREILDEVMREGDEGQRETAQSMLDQLG